MSDPLQYRRYRAPQGHGQSLISPPLTGLRPPLARWTAKIDLLGQPLTDLQTETRTHVLALACENTRQYRDMATPVPDLPVVMSGHQPQLFHPGVWFKNFILSRFGRHAHANAINLVIDNDLCRSPAVRIPSGSREAPHTTSVNFDTTSEPLPYEERLILDRECLNTFAKRTRQALSELIPAPLVEQLWNKTHDLRQRATHLGTYLAEARHHLEGELGLQTWEVQLSQVCDTAGFHRFFAAILTDASRLQAIYNACLHDYRTINRVRSLLHPVPDLITTGDWQELPFWIWSARVPQRRRLFVRRTRLAVHLSDRDKTDLQLPATDRPEQMLAALRDLREQGYKIRPRALMTTMFARLLLCDTFLHGIGGGKYDQVTDAILQRFFQVPPPPFTVVTATWLLPLLAVPKGLRDLRAIDQAIRELRFHPEIYAPHSPAVDALAQQKQNWIAETKPRGERLHRHQQITALNEKLQAHVTERRSALLSQRSQTAQTVRHSQILASRETTFCAFPQESLCTGLLELARQAFYINDNK